MSLWYDKDGTPRYEIKGKGGNLRPTTLADARKNGWVPSVSTVWKDVVAAPGLTRWSLDLLFKSQLLNKQRPDESDESYRKRVFDAYTVESTRARDQGTKIHGILEENLKSGAVEEYYDELIKGTKEALLEICGTQDWNIEQSFAHPLGYGGQVDIYSDEWVVDFKTKDQLDNGKKPWLGDGYGVQLAAYDHGVGGGRKLLNLFISVSSPGYVYPYQWEDKDRLFNMFTTAFNLWKLIKRYEP